MRGTGKLTMYCLLLLIYKIDPQLDPMHLDFIAHCKSSQTSCESGQDNYSSRTAKLPLLIINLFCSVQLVSAGFIVSKFY